MNTEFWAAITMLIQANQGIVAITNALTLASRGRDITRIKPHEFYDFKVNKDPRV